MPQSPKMAGSPAAVPAMPGAPQPAHAHPAIPQQPTRPLQLPAHIGPLKIDPEMLSADEPLMQGEIPTQKVELPPELREKLPPFDDPSTDDAGRNPALRRPWRPQPPPHTPRPQPYPWDSRTPSHASNFADDDDPWGDDVSEDFLAYCNTTAESQAVANLRDPLGRHYAREDAIGEVAHANTRTEKSLLPTSRLQKSSGIRSASAADHPLGSTKTGVTANPLEQLPQGEITADSLYERARVANPTAQKPFVARDSDIGDELLDWVPHAIGGPLDDFGGADIVSEIKTDKKPSAPFDPNQGYYARIEQRRRTQAEKMSGLEVSGRDIDRRPYNSLFRVGRDLNDPTTNKLRAPAIRAIVAMLIDDKQNFRDGEEAKAWLDANGYPVKAMPDRTAAFFIDLDTPDGSADRRMTMGTIGTHMGATIEKDEAHEIGHLFSMLIDLRANLEALPSSDRDTIEMELKSLFKPRGVSDWDGSPEEWVGEFFKDYLLDPERAKENAPFMTSLIRKLWNENDRLNKILVFS